MIYQLYFRTPKETCGIPEYKLTLKQIDKSMESVAERKLAYFDDSEVIQYNDCYYFSRSRKALKEKALAIKWEWEQSILHELDEVRNIKF